MTAAAPPDDDAPRGEKLQKVLARAGVASRRKAEALIEAGRVSVDGRTAALGSRVGPDADIRLDGRPLEPTGDEAVYLMLNKPPGVLTTARDDFGRPTVMGLVPASPGLHPVGRLDLDSEGLLILTSDGELTLRLTHPRYRHDKEYRVWCAEGTVGGEALARLVAGVDLDDGPAAALSARAARHGAILVLGEGRKRQVKRMLDAVGYRVTRLKRTRISGLELGDLALGSYRELRPDDLRALGYILGGARGKAHRAPRRDEQR